ncbi:DUF1570 domain-containing protein [Engelhardtia mirabilis]|uniref:DUF1570 domain-containing protein n=1 Tax=Engelhardtia mirabilis TaxID=2528011 RepID=A0A518BF81_9BACT|nr:hypothetical protein Pla133_07020 [Planctomycetes bacterium Pla133]QDU99962.1 hypothetical protein Pla86_07010 [Planctomycetes bacterium Pla86]
MLAPFRTLAAVLVASLFLGPLAAAQGGYRTTSFDDLGFELPVPRNYKAVPVEPTEKWVALKWIDEKTNAREREDYVGAHANFLPELMVLWIDHVAVAATTPSGEEGGDGGSDEDQADQADPIRDFETYLEQVWKRSGKPMYSISEPERLDDVDGNDALRYELRPLQGMPPGWATVFRSARRSLVFMGRGSEFDFRDQEKIWEHMIDGIELFQPEALDMSKWEKFYEKRPEFIDAAYRLQVRSTLVRGWEADDTENYIFVYSTKDQPLLRLLKRELEAIRLEYEELFPPAAPVTAVSTVRVCRDGDEYRQYGGPSGSGGYWNSAAKELVFYDYSADEEKRGEGKEDSRIVLYHEAFHQFIYYSVGEVAPHSWYNEGTGDFFSGAKISGKKVNKIDVNPWRNNYIRSIVAAGRNIPFEDILGFTQAEFYRPDRRGICYAQAWSMIYFLRTSKEVANHEQWSQILPIYFETLKAAYAEQAAELLAARSEGLEPDEAPPELSRGEKEVISQMARDKALEVAFDGIDVLALERQWLLFIEELKELR